MAHIVSFILSLCPRWLAPEVLAGESHTFATVGVTGCTAAVCALAALPTLPQTWPAPNDSHCSPLPFCC